jgi:hypothetical protein
MIASDIMTENHLHVDYMFDPEKRHAAAQVAAFEATRPDEKDDGRIYAPLTDNIIDPNEYFESQREYRANSSNLPYEELPATVLIEKMGDAESYNDITTLTDAEQVLAEKLRSENLAAADLARQLAYAEFHDSSLAASIITDSLVEKLVEQESAAPNISRETTQDRNARSDNLVNFVLKVKDREFERLRQTASETEPEPSQSEPPAPIEPESEPEPTPEPEPEPHAAVDEAVAQAPPAEASPAPDQQPENIVTQEEAERLVHGGKMIRFDTNDGSSHSYALEYAQPGTTINWQDYPWAQEQDRKIVLTDVDGNQYYINGNVIYDISESRAQNTEVSWEDDNLAQLTPVVIGEGWKLADDFETRPIQSVHVQYTPQNESQFVHEYRSRPDPFGEATSALTALSYSDPQARQYQGDLPPPVAAPQQNNQILMGSESVDNTPEPPPAAVSAEQYFGYSQLSRRERLRNWWAARRAGGLAVGGTTVTRTREWFNDDPTGRRRKAAIVAGALIGGAVVVGLAYLAAKGLFNVEEHHPKGHHQPTHTGTTPARTSVPDTTPAAPTPQAPSAPTSPEGTVTHHHYHLHGHNASKHIARFGDTTSYAGRLGHSGSTIWGNEELRIRHFHPDWSQQRVYHAANWMSRHILHLNHLTETQAEDLPVDFRYAR